MRTLSYINWKNKIAVLRTDLNAPLNNNTITDTSRIIAAVPTIKTILNNGGSVVVLSHLGRPEEGIYNADLSTSLLTEALADALQHPVQFYANFPSNPIAAGQVALLENTRFNKGEKKCDPALSQQYATLGDVFVMDAFASAHRTEASVTGIASYLPSCAGQLLIDEITALNKISRHINRPFVGVFGGAKISTKLDVLNAMGKICDTLIVGGGIANTLLAAQGHKVSRSLVQFDMLENAKTLLQNIGQKIILPTDVIVADNPNAEEGQNRMLLDIKDNDMILDIGIDSAMQCQRLLLSAQTVLWNGPVGLFENPPFANGTQIIANTIAQSSAFSVIGGGDTIAACNQFNVTNSISYVSTGGGALLDYLANGDLPGLSALYV